MSNQLEVVSCGSNIRLGNVSTAVRARTSGGHIVMGDVGGEVRLSTLGGDIEVGRVSGGASLHTSGGDIRLKGAVGLVVAKTSGGHIRLENISGVVEAASSGGNILVEMTPTGEDNSRLTTIRGNVNLYLPENCGAIIQARIKIQGDWKTYSSKYAIASDFRSQVYEMDESVKEIRATYDLNGGGRTVILKTINGNIEIRLSRAKAEGDNL